MQKYLKIIKITKKWGKNKLIDKKYSFFYVMVKFRPVVRSK